MGTLRASAKLRGLARNPALPPHLLDVFVAAADDRLRLLLAFREDLSAEHVRVLDGVPDGIDEGLLRGLVDPAPDPWLAVGDVSGDPAALLADLLTHPDEEVRLDLAVRPDLTHEAYARLAKDPVPAVRREVAGNPAVHESLLRELVAEPDQELHRRLLHNPAITLELLASLAVTARLGPSLVPRVETASDAELRTLAEATAPQVRMLVAERTDLPADLLGLLVADQDPGVAKCVITNPTLTADQLWALVTRHGRRVYPGAARNPNCPPDLLHHLAVNARWVREVYQEIAQHRNTDAETLLLCLADRDARRHAARHPNLPAETVVELLDDDREVAEAAAANPSLPERVMAELLGA